MRAPIVTVLGHVDHGKTTLLDVIRKTDTASREAGGITQSVGSSKVKTESGEFSFLDTPGHSAFSAMRLEGAKVADVAVLAVAADDGAMPQTREAIKYLRETQTPFVVAITKTDLPGANIEKALSSLEKEGVLLEKRGGDVPYVALSAKKKEGIEDLLAMIKLLFEVTVSQDTDSELEAYVVEAAKKKHGPTALVAIKKGEIQVGDALHTREAGIKVRAIFGSSGEKTSLAGAGEVVEILGFSDVPKVGSKISRGPVLTEKIREEKRAIPASGEETFPVVLRADTDGSLRAAMGSLPDKVHLVSADVGEVGERDVLLAKSMGAHLLAFNLKIPVKITKLGMSEGVPINQFSVIYDLLDYVGEGVEKRKSSIKGAAQIMAEFPYDNKKIAGVSLSEGELKQGDNVTLMRGEQELGTAKIISMRKGKNEISFIRAGEEGGLLLTPQLDFAKGDVLISSTKAKT